MYIPKRYGQSKVDKCPFCGKQSITSNKQGVPVCLKHKTEYLELKCLCGDWLDIRSGKWGPFCTCIKCGALSFSKALSINPAPKPKTPDKDDQKNDSKPASSLPKRNLFNEKRTIYSPKKTAKTRNSGVRKEIIITSDEVDLYC